MGVKKETLVEMYYKCVSEKMRISNKNQKFV